MRVLITPGARRRLREIETYIANEASPRIARDLITRILRHVQLLEQHSLLGQRMERYANADVRELHERPYRVIYRIRDGCIEILTLMHYRQLLPSDLHDLELRSK
ncbi:MAG: type II toxin-antitoxin system RelE/ParE family toxin [Lysobacterales bacterium]